MRQYIDITQRLTEADVIPFPSIRRAAAVAQDRKRFTLLVFAATSQGAGMMPKLRLVDHLGGLSAEEVVNQLHNYHPQDQRGNTWISKPMGDTSYYMRVLVGHDTPSERDLAEINHQMQIMPTAL